MPRKLSNGSTYYGPDVLGEYYDALTNTKGWLYGSWSKQKLDTYTVLRAVPVFNNYMDYLLDLRNNDEYLRRYGMDYSDIHDPRGLSSTSSGSRLAANSYSYVSRNIHRLYG